MLQIYSTGDINAFVINPQLIYIQFRHMTLVFLFRQIGTQGNEPVTASEEKGAIT